MTTPAGLIDLSPFCDPESQRYALGAPRLVGAMVCATDGRILIRCRPDKAVPFEPQHGRFPKVDDIIGAISDVTKWGRVEIAPCDQCSSTGFVMTECKQCRGAGHDYCPACERDGDCAACDGEGESHEPCACSGTHRIGDFRLRPEHAYLVDSLPDVEWQLDARTGGNLYFRFTFGDGVITPLPEST